MTGKPIFFASTRAVSASGMMSEPGVMGTPLATAVARAVALSPICEITLAEGPMKVMPELVADFGETGVFREESVAGVDGIGTGDLGGGDDAVDLEVGFLAGGRADADGFVGELDVHGIDVRLGIDGDGFDAEFAAGADDAEGDFAAIGDQDALEHEGSLLVFSGQFSGKKTGHLI